MINGCHTRLREERIKVMAKKNEAKVKFSAETKEFNDAIKQSNKEISVLKSELKLNAAEMKNAGTSTEALGKKHQLLKKEQEAQRDKTKALNAQLQSAKHIFGEDSQEVANLTKKLNASKVAEQNIEKEIKATNAQLKNQKVDTKELAEAQDKLKKGMDKVSNGAGVVAGSTIAIGAGAVKLFNEVDKGSDAAVIATGATGEAAEELKKNYKNVAGSVKGDFADIGSALGEVETRFEFTGKKAEDCTTRFIKFAEINGVDATQAVRLVSRAMGDAGIEADKYDIILDQLTVAAQASGIGVSNLAESLAKYGAPMRNLGFDTKESIALFAQWEKAGVNTEIAFSGMKKAISNWGKEGKDARVEFKKTLEEIQNTPDIASATTKAIEVFGAKAGPDLADAIKGGRFEYSKFLKVLDKSEGSLENTYEAIHDGSDKAEVAMQNLKIAGAEVGEALLKQVDPVIEDIVKKSKEFAEYAEKHGDEIVTTIKTIGVVAGTTFAINKTVKFGRSLADISKFGAGVVKSVKAMALARAAETTATEAQTVAQNGLNASMLASPIGLTIASVTALAAGIVYLNEKYKETSEETKQFIEEQKLKSDEAKSALEELTSSVKEHDEEVNKTYDTYESQLEQLDNIVDKDGKIKKGKEELAALITGELSEASGIEIEIIDGQIQQYQNLEEQIKKTIKQKRIEALLEAGKDDWIQAQQTREEYETKVYDQKNVVNTAEKELKEAQETRDAYLNQNWLKRLQQELFYKTGTSTKKNLDEAREKYNSAMETYNNTLATYESAGDTIGRYESLLAASTSKSTKEINTALAGYTNNMKNATSATTSELILQVNTTEEKLKEVKKKYDKGEVSKSVLNEYRRMKRYAKQQLDLKLEDTKNEQSKEVEQYQKDDVPNAAADNAKKTVDVVQGTLKLANFSTEGKKSANTFTQEYTDNKGKKAGRNILNGISKKFGSANFSVDGNNAVNTFLNKFTGIKGINAGKTVAKGVNSGLRDYLKKNPFNLDVSLNAKIKIKNKNLKDLQEIMLGGGVAHNAKGNIIKNPILTTFAEDGPEAAIPINDKPRSKALWLQTGQMMGMINTRVGERAISNEIDLRETNTLLRRIASKDPNMYMDSMQVSKATSKARDIVDGMESILIGRGVARE